VAGRSSKNSGILVAGDLIPDRVLKAAEEDAFSHAAIVGRIAELVTVAEPPLNVVLFGPWGSGKSWCGLRQARLRRWVDVAIAFLRQQGGSG
jgi:hypothetical protein